MRSNLSALLLAFTVLIGFTPAVQAQTVTWNSIQVAWTTPGDDSLTGLASQFDLRYSTSPITIANFSLANRWNSTPTPAAPGTRQTSMVTGLTPNTTYYFALKTGDEVPNWAGISNVISRTTLAAPDTIRPESIGDVALTVLGETSIRMNWTATGDDSLTGTATSYDIRYSTSPITSANWSSATTVTGEPAPAAPGTAQSYTVTGLTRQTNYYFAMKVTDDGGLPSAISNVPNATTPDQTPPATVRDLVVGFVWFGWHGGDAEVETRPVHALVQRTTGR